MGCRRTASAAELVRLAWADGGRFVVGPGHPGRGAWLCPQRRCAETAAHRGAFGRALRTTVTADAVAELVAGWPPGG